VVGALATVIVWFRSLSQTAKNVTNEIGKWFSNLGVKVGNIWNNIKNTAINAFNSIWGFISRIVNKISNKIRSLSGVFSNISKTIVNVIKSPINGLIRLLNNFIRSVNKIKIPSWVPSIGGKGIKISTISYLAQGGIISAPTLAVMGEGGYKEAVLPLDRNTDWAEEVANLISTSASGSPINLTVKIGEKEIYKGFIDYANERSLASNSKLLML
jgi:hypothetical protein